jgi:hypothetical protein
VVQFGREFLEHERFPAAFGMVPGQLFEGLPCWALFTLACGLRQVNQLQPLAFIQAAQDSAAAPQWRRGLGPQWKPSTTSAKHLRFDTDMVRDGGRLKPLFKMSC